MLELFKSSVTPMLMMFTCIIIGYVLNRLKLLPENADTVLAKLENYVLVPALNISTFMNYCTVESLVSYRSYVAVSTVLVVVAVAVSYPLSRLFSKDDYERNIYKYALTFGNFGFLGNAIVPIILGEEFLYPYMLFTLPISAVCYTWGLSALTPKESGKTSVFKNLLNPCVLSIFIGMILGLFKIQPFIPTFLNLSLGKLSNCMGPIAMVLTGFVAAKFNFASLLKKTKVYFATLLRLAVLPTIFLILLYLLKIDDLVIKMCLFAFATPLGLNTVVFPTAYGKDASTGASMALISHTLAVVTIPLLYSALNLVLSM
jgi:predicted permease